MVVLMLAVGRQPAIPANAVLAVRVEGDLADSASDTVFEAVVGARRNGTRTIVENLRKAKADRPDHGRHREAHRAVDGLLGPAAGGAGRDPRFQGVRQADRRAPRVHGGDREFFVASACSQCLPAAHEPARRARLRDVRALPPGHARQGRRVPRFPAHRRLQDRAEPVRPRRRSPRPTARLAESPTRDLFEQFVQAVADGRKKTPAEVRELVDDGPFLAEDAVRVGLVDDVAYDDQLDVLIKTPGKPSSSTSARPARTAPSRRSCCTWTVRAAPPSRRT